MKTFIRKWNSLSLVARIVIGLVIGALLGFFVPSDGSALSQIITLLGTLFVGALKAVAPILVLFLIISALCNAKAPKSMRTIIVLYLVSTFVAAVVAVFGSYLVPMELVLPSADDISQSSPAGIGEVLESLVMNIVDNPIDALLSISLGDESKSANYIGVLAWAILLGVALRAAKDSTKEVFTSISDAIATVVRWIINCAPFGILGLVYDAVATNGVGIFAMYGQIILLLVCCMLFIALVTNPLIVFITTRKNPYPLVLRCLKDSGITAFFTRSSAANIPVNMELCESLGLDKNLYSVSIPLGATINMAGAAVTITVMAMQAAFTVGLSVDIPTAIILAFLAAISACGASGVPGGSLLLIPMACSLFGIPNEVAMQVVAIGFIISVIQDSCETALNSSSDALFSATAEYRSWIKAGRRDFKMGVANTPLIDVKDKVDGAAEEGVLASSVLTIDDDLKVDPVEKDEGR